MSTVSNLLRLEQTENQVRELNRHVSENVLKRYLPASVVEDILAGRIGTVLLYRLVSTPRSTLRDMSAPQP